LRPIRRLEDREHRKGKPVTFELNRRRFVQLLGALSASAAAIKGQSTADRKSAKPSAPKSGVTRNRKNLVATQLKAYAWQDEGIDKLLDNLQGKGNINTVFAFTFLSEPTDVSGRIPLPDHGTYSKADPEIGGLRRNSLRFCFCRRRDPVGNGLPESDLHTQCGSTDLEAASGGKPESFLETSLLGRVSEDASL